ncbi:MAG: GNAT family N-acetyltransferase [Anaerolineales bacterium]|nr:GNAT family N-acetyltransferase [Anaerolineales bacterium]
MIRRVVESDRRALSALLAHELNTHRHLDWRAALDWIGEKNFWALERENEIVAALACPEDPPNVAWIRLFSFSPQISGAEAWSALWDAAFAEMQSESPNARVAAIVTKQWFQSLLLQSGFQPQVNIVLLELLNDNYALVPSNPLIQIRAMKEDDLNVVAEADRAAFGELWHNALDSLRRAYGQSFYSTVAEDERGIIGYQISTGNSFGAHLARLAVRPQAQGKGVGAALVRDLARRARSYLGGRLTVNTQSDNAASLSLYARMGFVRTGEYYPVLIKSMI